MPHLPVGIARPCAILFLFALAILSPFPSFAQFETATLAGQVVDPSGLSVPGAQVNLVDIDRGTTETLTTDRTGLYRFATVHPGRYRIQVHAAGFKVIDFTGLTVNVQDHLEQNFRLSVGSVSESVTVQGGAPLLDTETATVSTVVDRQFAENLPMNGRSFQTLIELTPGVVVTPTNANDTGQFSVNGQRAASNYWTLDGVSANIGIGVNQFGTTGNGLAGSVASFSVMGGTNSLVSVDALQEFRIQTSTYAPEFGRMPGAQISILTRSGTNELHGTLFDYFRNDILDANDWFADRDQLRKPQERQNDFGGTLGGPIIKDRTFFFFSYEGLRLRLPQVSILNVPDLSARQGSNIAMQPYLAAFPLPTPGAPDNVSTGLTQFDASFSDQSTLDAASIRIDHRIGRGLNLFGRYDYSPSKTIQRGGGGDFSLNTVNPLKITTQTATAGATWAISANTSNEFRFNYSRVTSSGKYYVDAFGGGSPLASLPFPSSFTVANALFSFQIAPILPYNIGSEGSNVQRQVNIVDNVSWQRGPHSIRVGVDFRRLSPRLQKYQYRQVPFFLDVPSAETGTALFTPVDFNVNANFLFRNFGAFAQDTWRIGPRLTITYGLRWDIDFVARSLDGPNLPAAAATFNLSDLSNLALATPGTPPYTTKYGNVAPRIGIAYEPFARKNWQTVLRGGFGLFYDLASSEAGNNLGFTGRYPFGSDVANFFVSFPLANPNPVPIAPPTATNPGIISLFDRNLSLPRTFQWNASIEQSLGTQQALTVTYLGAAGRRLLQSALVSSPTPAFTIAELVMNFGSSDYDALQVQFQRRLSHGLQVLASYAWSHSIDTGSAGSIALASNLGVPSSLASTNRGPSDFDIRHAFSAGITYEIPPVRLNAFTNAVLRGWSADNVIQLRSAPPVDVEYGPASSFQAGISGDVRPDLVHGQPLYLYGANCASVFQATGDLGPGQSCPGDRGFNPNAFTAPPTDSNGNALRQGDLGRNALRGFGAAQWDFAVHREFKLSELLKLQFRGEMFNFLNHPNFGPPIGDFGFGPGSGFGVSREMLGRSLGGFGSSGSGAFSSLYQVGGPRSIQLALKLIF